MGEPERLGPKSVDARTPNEERGILSRAADGGGPDRLPTGPHREEAVGSQQRPAGARRPWEPLLERRSDPLEFGRTPRDRDNWETELSMQEVEVEDVESADHGTVDENGANAVDRSQASDERDEPSGSIGTIDPDLGRPNGFDMFR